MFRFIALARQVSIRLIQPQTALRRCALAFFAPSVTRCFAAGKEPLTMARPEHPLQFVILPPEDEPIFRFGASLLAEKAVVWLEGAQLVWMHRMVQRSLSLFHLRRVSAFEAALCGTEVRHLSLVPYSFIERAAILPALTFQDRFGPALEQVEPDFGPFIRHFLARLRLHRPFLTVEGDEAVLLRQKG
jgi:hypothetical protein